MWPAESDGGVDITRKRCCGKSVSAALACLRQTSRQVSDLALGAMLHAPVYTTDRLWRHLKLGIDVRVVRG